MKINRLFSIAAATMMMVACSSEDTALKNTPAAGPQMQFTATIAAPGSGATTRTEYTEVTTGEAAGTISVAWKVGDEIALIHNGVKDVATVKTVNADGSATINGYVTGATNEADVQLYYPAALVKSVTNDGNPVFDNDLWGKISTQDGTLKYIQDNLDFRSAKGQLSVNGTEVTLKEPVKMAAENAIWKLTLKDDAETPAALAASQLAIMIGSDTIASTAILSTAASTVYLAVPGMADKAITIGATVDEDTYAYKKEGVTLASGKYYQSTVNMSMVKTIDLSELQGDCEAKNGYTLTGTLGKNVKISIAAGATVTLDGVTINGVDDSDYSWAGITCLGDATIILKDGTTNTVNGFFNHYPGIYVPGDAENPANNKTLTIKGTGSLTANCKDKNGWAAGIGGGYEMASGNIVIAGGTINATGGLDAGIGSGRNASCGAITISGGTVSATGGSSGAGIGSGHYGKCGDILISGGTVEATGGAKGAGIGSGKNAKCGDITITTGVTQVTATKGSSAPNSIGAGEDGNCGTVTIGCTLDNDGKPVGGTQGAITSSPYTYQNLTYPIALSAVTSAYVGSVVTTDGNVYATAKDATDAGKTAVAMICYVGDNGEDAPYNHGLALALTDESSTMKWEAAKTECNTTKNTSIPVTNARWLLASKDQWGYMSSAVLSNIGLQVTKYYWSSTYTSEPFLRAWAYRFSNNSWIQFSGSNNDGANNRVRACLAF